MLLVLPRRQASRSHPRSPASASSSAATRSSSRRRRQRAARSRQFLWLIIAQTGMVPADAILAGLVAVALDFALSTRPTGSSYKKSPASALSKSFPLGEFCANSPYRILRWPRMIRLASSVVRVSRFKGSIVALGTSVESMVNEEELKM